MRSIFPGARITAQGRVAQTLREGSATGSLALSKVMQGPEQRFTESGLHGFFMVVVEGNGIQRTHKLVLQ